MTAPMSIKQTLPCRLLGTRRPVSPATVSSYVKMAKLAGDPHRGVLVGVCAHPSSKPPMALEQPAAKHSKKHWITATQGYYNIKARCDVRLHNLEASLHCNFPSWNR